MLVIEHMLKKLRIKKLSICLKSMAVNYDIDFPMQYGRILDIELKIPPRPPCYCFVEVLINTWLFSCMHL